MQSNYRGKNKTGIKGGSYRYLFFVKKCLIYLEKSRGLQILFENLGLEADNKKKDNFLDYYAENKAGMKHDRKELLTSMFIRRKIV